MLMMRCCFDGLLASVVFEAMGAMAITLIRVVFYSAKETLLLRSNTRHGGIKSCKVIGFARQPWMSHDFRYQSKQAIVVLDTFG